MGDSNKALGAVCVGARTVRQECRQLWKEKISVTSGRSKISKRFPRSEQYHPDWVLASISSSANALWLSEWLAAAMDLQPGMRVLDLGCGRAASSIFLRREFGVQVWATDLWFSASENLQRIRDAGVEDGVFPLHADARSLPFADEFLTQSFASIASLTTARMIYI